MNIISAKKLNIQVTVRHI